LKITLVEEEKKDIERAFSLYFLEPNAERNRRSKNMD
jgi:hypothetical protein